MQIYQKPSVTIIAGLILLIVVLCVTVPGFYAAILRFLECNFGPNLCVKVIQ